MPNIHPTIVHFPIALLIVAFFFDASGVVLKKVELTRVGWWCQSVGTVFLVAAVATGLFARDSIVVDSVALQTLEAHEQFAFLSSSAFIVLLFWRVGLKTRLPTRMRFLFWGLYVLGVSAIVLGAWYGGEMVFRFGLGVKLLSP